MPESSSTGPADVRMIDDTLAWRRATDALLKGICHALNGRLGAVSGLIQISRFDHGLDDESGALLDSELERMVRIGVLLRLIPADRVAFLFFGYRGPWYTVGWHLGAIVERRFGRAALLEAVADPRRLLALYDEAAKAEGLARFSPALLAALR